MVDPLAIITRLIREQVMCAGAVSPGDLLDDLGLDGLDRQAIAMDLEDHFQIEISDTALEQWSTVADILATLLETHHA